jgi:hypothetical protein
MITVKRNRQSTALALGEFPGAKLAKPLFQDRTMRHAFLATVCLFAACSTTSAADIFVNNVLGDDRRGGSQPAVTGENIGPCLTIAKALRITQPGDRIILASTGQPYRESITIQGPRHSGSARYPTTILGGGAILDGTISLEGAVWEYAASGIFRTRPPHLSYQQLFLDDQPLARRQPASGQAPLLEPREWCLADGWIYFRVEEGKLPESYNLSCCGEQVGITLYEVHDVVIRDLVVRGFWLDGVNCHDGVRDGVLANILSSDNGRSGFSIGGASRVRLENCSAAGNSEAQLRTEGFCTLELIGGSFDPATAPPVIREGGRILQPAP